MQNDTTTINKESVCSQLNNLTNDINNPLATTNDNSTDNTDNKFALFEKRISDLTARRENGEDVSNEVKQLRQDFEKFIEDLSDIFLNGTRVIIIQLFQ